MDKIIQAFSQAKDYVNMRLYIVGDGEQREMLKELILNEGLSSDIVMTGALPRDEVLSYFKAADVVVALGSINPLMEAMSCGKPVITLELGGTSAFVKNGKDVVLINDVAPQTIADAITELCNNKGLREQIGRNALLSIKETFMTWKDRIEKEVNIIETVVKNHEKTI